MKKDRQILWIIFLLLTSILFLSGCSDNNGSYMAPISVLPYTQGETGALRGVIRTTIKPSNYFTLLRRTSEEDSEDASEIIISGDTYEILYGDEDTATADFEYDDIFDTRVKVNIRIGAKVYSYNPEFEDEYVIEDIPVGFHTIVIEGQGFESFTQNIVIEDNEKNIDFVIEPTEYKAPNYFNKISNSYVTVRKFEKSDEEDDSQEVSANEEEEEEMLVYFLRNKVTRFLSPDIKVYIDEDELVSNGLLKYKEDFIEMLALWENAGADIKFKFVTEREIADITVLWQNIQQGYIWTQTDEEYPYRAFKPVIKLPLFNPVNGEEVNVTFRRAVMAREIGRSLGLIGGSANNNDIMYYGEDLKVEGDISLSTADKNTLIMLYNTVPAVSEKTYTLD